MDRLKKPKDFLEKLRLTDNDYKDIGMINHIADLLERYNTEQLALIGVMQAKPGKVCEHEDKYWIEDEGGDWYCGECDPVANF
jgi:Tfp pilus assembly protein PilP